MKSLKLFFLLVLSTECLTAQTQDEIQTIRNHFTYVESNLDKFEQTSEMTFDDSSDGATIKRYFDDGELVKIRIEYLGEAGKLWREFYINDQELLFVFDQEFRYNMPYYVDSTRAKEMGFDEWHDPEKTKKLEHRYYFFNNQMIRWVNPNGEHQSQDNPEWKEMEEYYLDELAKLK